MTSEEARAIRTEAGLTQAQLAAALGVRRATVSDTERGAQRPSPLYALALRWVVSQIEPRPSVMDTPPEPVVNSKKPTKKQKKGRG
jgi:DNA-binding XRE family transcriptional regulator